MLFALPRRSPMICIEARSQRAQPMRRAAFGKSFPKGVPAAETASSCAL